MAVSDPPMLVPVNDKAVQEACRAVEDAPAQESEQAEFKTAEFRMYYMKVLPCSKRYCHDWTTCPFAHPQEKAKRRDPRVYNYTGIACAEMKRDQFCPRGDRCPYAHNVFEYWLHPTRYCTQMCNDGDRCKRKICFFAHALDELRVPAARPYVSPETLAAATAASHADTLPGLLASGLLVDKLGPDAASLLAAQLAGLNLQRPEGSADAALAKTFLQQLSELQRRTAVGPSAVGVDAESLRRHSAADVEGRYAPASVLGAARSRFSTDLAQAYGSLGQPKAATRRSLDSHPFRNVPPPDFGALGQAIRSSGGSRQQVSVADLVARQLGEAQGQQARQDDFPQPGLQQGVWGVSQGPYGSPGGASRRWSARHSFDGYSPRPAAEQAQLGFGGYAQDGAAFPPPPPPDRYRGVYPPESAAPPPHAFGGMVPGPPHGSPVKELGNDALQRLEAMISSPNAGLAPEHLPPLFENRPWVGVATTAASPGDDSYDDSFVRRSLHFLPPDRETSPCASPQRGHYSPDSHSPGATSRAAMPDTAASNPILPPSGSSLYSHEGLYSGSSRLGSHELEAMSLPELLQAPNDDDIERFRRRSTPY